MNGGLRQESEITALLIAPDRVLVQQLLDTLPRSRAFQILADLTSYPPAATVDIRVRQLRPNVILLDLASDLGADSEAPRIVPGRTRPGPPLQVRPKTKKTRFPFGESGRRTHLISSAR